MYLWQDRHWPNFVWDDGALLPAVSTARLAHGRLLGTMAQLDEAVRRQAEASALVADAVQTSAIEGEVVDAEAVRSSLARRSPGLGAGKRRGTPQTEGLAALGLDTLHNHAEPLSLARILRWHTFLAPAFAIEVSAGRWRDDAGGPMQVVSGRIDRPQVHFEAPAAARIPAEMDALVAWFNGPFGSDGLLRSAMAHLWFVTVHPFDDGNGRVARALGDLALSQDQRGGRRLYSMASQIQAERTAYYKVLEATQRGTLNITAWLLWYVGCFQRAVEAAQHLSDSVTSKGRFWEQRGHLPLNERQRKVLNRLLDGFTGNLTAKKWASLCKVSVATAQRDLADLVAKGMLQLNPGGSKRTSYRLAPLGSAGKRTRRSQP